jgi:transcriptional regulator with XRE-family HTH domain
MGRLKSDAVVAERFRELIEQLGDKRGRARGWQSELAEELGMHRSEISKLRKGQRNASWDLARQVAQKIGLNMSFFTAPGGCHFSSHVRAGADTNGPSRELSRRFIALAEWLGQQRYASAHGWKTRVADDLGMSATYLSRVLTGRRAVGLRLATEVAARVPLHLSYFTAPEYAPPYAPQGLPGSGSRAFASAEHGL